MKLSDFSFKLPTELIARYPLEKRSTCRLLSLNGVTGETELGFFTDILKKLNSGDLLIFNDTRVIPARLYGQKITGGKVELLIERILDNRRALAHIKASRVANIDSVLCSDGDTSVLIDVLGRQGSLFELQFPDKVLVVLDKIGHMPLPPYIARADNELDRHQYQTIYSKVLGAVAAPTAGLHFDQLLIDDLKARGVETGFITLHIGAGTFQPVRVNHISQHRMHAEYAVVSPSLVEQVIRCKARGNRIVAVGTSTARALESAVNDNGVIESFCADTDIFIYPGFQFNVIDVLITNFHLPQSTLLMLVSAFAGYKNIMNAYKVALEQRFRFFSYGDAMWITKKPTMLS